jgi:hypothetical protein
MSILLKLIVIGVMWIGSAFLCDRMGINPLVGPGMVLFGGVSFFLGPYATGSGFLVGNFAVVNSPTPEKVWKAFGILLWVAAGITMLFMWKTKGA